jgi:hypothetical protein
VEHAARVAVRDRAEQLRHAAPHARVAAVPRPRPRERVRERAAGREREHERDAPAPAERGAEAEDVRVRAAARVQRGLAGCGRPRRGELDRAQARGRGREVDGAERAAPEHAMQMQRLRVDGCVREGAVRVGGARGGCRAGHRDGVESRGGEGCRREGTWPARVVYRRKGVEDGSGYAELQ